MKNTSHIMTTVIEIQLPKDNYKQPTLKQQLAKQEQERKMVEKCMEMLDSDNIVLIPESPENLYSLNAINVYNLKTEFQIYLARRYYWNYEKFAELTIGNRTISMDDRYIYDKAIEKFNKQSAMANIIEQEIKFKEMIGTKPYISKFVRKR